METSEGECYINNYLGYIKENCSSRLEMSRVNLCYHCRWW